MDLALAGYYGNCATDQHVLHLSLCGNLLISTHLPIITRCIICLAAFFWRQIETSKWEYSDTCVSSSAIERTPLKYTLHYCTQVQCGKGIFRALWAIFHQSTKALGASHSILIITIIVIFKSIAGRRSLLRYTSNHFSPALAKSIRCLRISLLGPSVELVDFPFAHSSDPVSQYLLGYPSGLLVPSLRISFPAHVHSLSLSYDFIYPSLFPDPRRSFPGLSLFVSGLVEGT